MICVHSPLQEEKTITEKGQKTKIILLHFEDGDPEDPLNWSLARKWFTTFLLCMVSRLITTLSRLELSADLSHVGFLSR